MTENKEQEYSKIQLFDILPGNNIEDICLMNNTYTPFYILNADF